MEAKSSAIMNLEWEEESVYESNDEYTASLLEHTELREKFDECAWAVHWPVPWTACASGKSSDFPGVVRNPFPLVRFSQTGRFWAPLSETGPAPQTPWSKRSNFKKS